MKIIALESTNVKRLKAVSIVPTGNVVQISGPNASGKSSILDSIYMALAGKGAIPSKPVRRGEQSAVIKLDLGDVRVIRRFSSDGETSVVVEAASGARFPSPQTMLDKLLGKLTFDPLKFAQAEAPKQLETLRGLVKLDVDLDALDGQNARDYDERKEVNKRGKSLAERVATLELGLKPSMDVTPIDVATLTADLTAAFEHNKALERQKYQRENVEAQVARLRSDEQDIIRRIGALETQLGTVRNAIIVADEQLRSLPEATATLISTNELREKVVEAGRTNTERENQRKQRELYELAKADLEKAREETRALSDRMDARAAAKRKAIAEAKMPVDGLSFGDGHVLYNDVPFDQASQAEQIRVSFAIAMAANPELKVVLIRDGSLLDEENTALIATMAEEHGFQVWLERVGRADGTVGIVIEDGEVVSVDGVPAIAGAHTE